MQDNKEKKLVALHHLTQALLIQSQYDEVVGFIMEGIELSEERQDTASSGFFYNKLGYTFIKQGNEVQAIEYVNKALTYLKNTDNYLELSDVYLNLGYIHTSLQDYYTAQKRFDICNDYNNNELKLHGVTYKYICHVIFFNVTRFHAYCKSEEYENANQCIKSIKECEEKMPSVIIKQYLIALNAKVAFLLKDKDKFIHLVGELLKEEQLCIVQELCDDYIDLLEYMVQCKNEKLCKKYLLMLGNQIELSETDSRLDLFYNAMKDFYKLTNNNDLLADIYVEYYSLFEMQKKRIQDAKLLNITTRQRINRELAENERFELASKQLKIRSEHDALTTLPNRYLLNSYSEEFYKKALQEQKPFGVIIIDIDYFKEYNDFFGHLSGDRCLKIIAQSILTCCKGHFCARFGGDEFCVISYAIGESELSSIAQRIQDDILSLKITKPEHGACKYVTVSQGICVGVPKNNQTYEDYYHEADMALYYGKRKERNSIHIGNLEFQ